MVNNNNIKFKWNKDKFKTEAGMYRIAKAPQKRLHSKKKKVRK